jgi:hypothetical protein
LLIGDIVEIMDLGVERVSQVDVRYLSLEEGAVVETDRRYVKIGTGFVGAPHDCVVNPVLHNELQSSMQGGVAVEVWGNCDRPGLSVSGSENAFYCDDGLDSGQTSSWRRFEKTDDGMRKVDFAMTVSGRERVAVVILDKFGRWQGFDIRFSQVPREANGMISRVKVTSLGVIQ